MKTRPRYKMICALLAMAFLSSPTAASHEYVLTMEGLPVRFVAEPDRGYMVKTTEVRSRKAEGRSVKPMDSSTTDFALPENAKPIGGIGRRGLWMVEGEQPRQEMRLHSTQGQQVSYRAPLFSVNGETVTIIPEIVIRVKPGIEERQVHFLCESMALAIMKPMEFTTQEYLLEVLGPDVDAVFTAVEQLSQASEVEWVVPNTAFRPKLLSQAVTSSPRSWESLQVTEAHDVNIPGVFPNDEYFPMQWHLHNTGQSGGTPGADIRAPEAWDITTGDPNIVIAVPDTGVDSYHPDLADNLVPGYDFYENDNQPDPALDQPGNTHGTGCAGLAAAKGNNALGVTGVTWDCKIMPIKVETVGGLYSDADIATAFRWMASNGADVITNSWGYGLAVPITHSAIIDVTRPDGLGRGGKGCVVVGASGNNGKNSVIYIARYPEVISVGGTDHNDVRCFYSNYGSQLDLVAPTAVGLTWEEVTRTEGLGWLWTTDLVGLPGWTPHPQNPYSDSPDYFGVMAGTSGSCPIAAGVAALILSIEPELTNEEVRHFLERSAKDLGDPGRDDYYGWGRVDARAALDMVLAKRCDLNSDCVVDGLDETILLGIMDVNDLSFDIAPAAKRDGIVDAKDLALLRQYLGTVIPGFGLLAYWKLDEIEGDIAYGSVAGEDAVVMGDALWLPAEGILNGAMQFDGIDDYLSASFILDPTKQPFSAYAWIKGGQPGQVIISQQGAFGEWLSLDAAGALTSTLTFPLPAVTSKVIITDDHWHHIGLVSDGSGISLYVDDSEVTRSDTSPILPAYGDLHIGTGKNREPGTFFSGMIDDIRIFDRAVEP